MPVRHAGSALALLTAVLWVATPAAAQPRPQTLAVCAACHGEGGKAPLPGMPALAAQPKVFIENQLVLIREGLRDVPSMAAVMGDIKDDEVVALAQYFAAQVLPQRGPPSQPVKAKAGGELAAKALCGTCHLPSYAGQQQVPRLAGQQEAYLLQALKEFRDKPGPGRDTLMSGPLQGMSDVDLANLAQYLAHLN
jgi:cytochrome c553